MGCSIAFLFLIRRHRIDVFNLVSIISRLVVLGLGAGLAAVVANDDMLYKFLASPAVLPTCLALFFLVLLFDKTSAAFCNWILGKTGEPYAKEHDKHHHTQHGGHGPVHMQDPAQEPLVSDYRKSVAWSTHPETKPLTADSAYQPPPQDYATEPLMSLPLHTPSPAA